MADIDKRKLLEGVLETAGGFGGAVGDLAFPGLGTGIRMGAGGAEKLLDLFLPGEAKTPATSESAPTAQKEPPRAERAPVPIEQTPTRVLSRARRFDAPQFQTVRAPEPRAVLAQSAIPEDALLGEAHAGELVQLPDGQLALVDLEPDTDAAAPSGTPRLVHHVVLFRNRKTPG